MASVFVLAALLLSPAVPQTPPAESASMYRRGPATRDGIGKFYFGREIAQVMGHQAANWLERPERVEEEAPQALLRALELKPGMVVADIGAGSGYFSFPMANLVGAKGKVYAVDIQPEMLGIIRGTSRRSGIRNVVPVLGTIKDPKVPAGSCDLMLMVDSYHEFDHPYEMVSSMVKGLKPGGRLVFVEYRGEDPFVPIKPLHKMTEAQVRKEMTPFPLEFRRNSGVLPRQHILEFVKK